MKSFTTEELSKMLTISQRKLKAIRDAGLIRFHRFGRSYTYTEQAVSEFLALTENVDLSSDEKIMAFGQTKRHVQPASKERTKKIENRYDSQEV